MFYVCLFVCLVVCFLFVGGARTDTKVPMALAHQIFITSPPPKFKGTPHNKVSVDPFEGLIGVPLGMMSRRRLVMAWYGLAIAKRKGAGKFKHINISCLWIQERQDSKQLELRKVVGTENPADLMTKHLARQSLDK